MEQEKPTISSLTITGIESKQYPDNKQITLATNKGKFKFNQKKKGTGEITKAYEQFQKFDFQIGDSVEVGHYSKEETFKNEKGEEITYMKNTLAYFATADENTPKTPDNTPEAPSSPQNAPQEPTGGVMTEINEIKRRLDALEGQEEKPLEVIQQEDETQEEKKDFIDSIPF